MSARTVLPWRILDDVSQDALSEENAMSLADQFGFEIHLLQSLSRQVSIALAPALNLSQPELIWPKKDRGKRELKKVLVQLEKAERALNAAGEGLQSLRFHNSFAYAGVPNVIHQHLAQYADSREAIGTFKRYLETMLQHGMVSYIDDPDRRKARDLRREIVCWNVFAFWDEQKRSLTYTTNPMTSERSGALFDFTNAIVMCVTDPPTRLKGETIRLDLKRFLDARLPAERNR